jgi:TRAP-type C4-dicarboxylate transport system permease small subunit
MKDTYTRVMDLLYQLCMVICVVAVVFMTVLIFIGVVMRYVFLAGAQFAEPMSIFFAVQLTMYGAAACFRSQAHLRLALFVNMLPPRVRRAVEIVVDLLLAALALVMIYYGANLVQTTWFQAYPEFIYIRVGMVYSAIPISGVIFLLFIIEAALFGSGPSVEEEELRRAIEHTEDEARRLAN